MFSLKATDFHFTATYRPFEGAFFHGIICNFIQIFHLNPRSSPPCSSWSDGGFGAEQLRGQFEMMPPLPVPLVEHLRQGSLEMWGRKLDGLIQKKFASANEEEVIRIVPFHFSGSHLVVHQKVADIYQCRLIHLVSFIRDGVNFLLGPSLTNSSHSA